ncbi:hypothetical protein SLEP1_g58603 [Rubroshorea leprosula]|uniref:Integrase catalytic domain-containing protein n=1 Tax=Rubroshorea leprosula TaxID=152421 RepID=A0AAV5MT38_9ROSI|nr:hypothetical protein SLEP1_g58603 [Rubroshorea leprosula]
MPRNLFVGGAEQDQLSETDDDERTPTGYATQPEQFQIPIGTRQRYPRQGNAQHERPKRSVEPARTNELEERTRVLEMAMGKILARLIPDDPLIPLLNRDAQLAVVVATRNSPALSNIVVPTKPRGSGKLNNEPSSSKHNEELMRKNADLERRWYHKLPRHSIDSYSQLAKLFSNKFVSQREIKHTATELMQVHQKKGESLRDYMQRFNKTTLDIDNVPDTNCLSALLHGLKPGRFLDNLLENPPKSWNEVNDWLASFILSEDFQSSKRRADDKQARNGKLEGYVQKPYVRQPTQTHFVQEYGQPQAPGYQLGQKASTQNQKDHERVGNGGIPSPSSTSNMISGDMHSGGQSARGRKAYARQVMTINKNRPLKRPFEEAEWENSPITFSPANYNSPDILYWSCFQKMQLNPSSLQKYEGPIYGFDNQPVPVEGVITLSIYVGSEPCFKMASVSFLVVKMELAFNAILGRATLCELKAVISQPHLCMKFPTSQGVGVLKGNQKMARACYQDTFKKVELATASKGPTETELTVHKLSTNPTKRVQKCRLFGLEKQAAINEEIQKLLQVGFIRRVEYSEWVSNPVLVKKPNGKWRMCIDFTNLNEACPKDPHPLSNVEKLVEWAAGHERMSFLHASSSYHQVQLLLDDQEKTTFYAGDAIYCYVMMPLGLKNAGVTYQKLNLRQAQMKLNPLKCTFAVESGKFLGFIARLAERCLPFFKALREPKNFQWTNECQQAFNELKKYLALAPLLSKPVEGKSLYLYMGVTEEAAVADFLVECISVTGEEKAPKHPVWVLYVDGATNIEGSGAGAVLVGPDDFKSEHALSDSQLVVGQVNGSCETKDPQLGRYASVVNKLKSGFVSFQINKIPRANNHRADELSKLASSQDINPQRSTFVELLDALSYTDLTIECHKLPKDSSTAKLVKRKAAHFTLLDNQLYKRAASMPLLRCLTQYEAEYAVREVHEGVCGTHIGGKTLAWKLLRHGYYWPTMVEDAQSYVKKCPTCQFNANDIHMPSILWWLKPVVSYANIVYDSARLFVYKFGIPKQIIADNGPQFRAAALRSFYDDYGIELALTSVYTPQSNGQAESSNKIVLGGLKMRVLAARSNWVDELNKVLWSCCTTPSSATSETPLSLTYGAEAVIPAEVGLPSDKVGQYDDPSNEQLLRENLYLVEEVKEMSRIRNMAYQGHVAKFYKKRVRAR